MIITVKVDTSKMGVCPTCGCWEVTAIWQEEKTKGLIFAFACGHKRTTCFWTSELLPKHLRMEESLGNRGRWLQ